MSKILSFSVDDAFAKGFDSMIEASGYKNRSRFFRDAATQFSELKQRGELQDMSEDAVVEGHIIVYYQHAAEHRLLEIRHSDTLNVTSYNHSCLSHSHTCVDVLHAIGKAKDFRDTIELFQNTPMVDKVVFASAPVRDEGCC
jgi:metal-responsive CopG/Arc/MetJ family transcriptional regulator